MLVILGGVRDRRSVPSFLRVNLTRTFDRGSAEVRGQGRLTQLAGRRFTGSYPLPARPTVLVERFPWLL
jgi:hypothetical protein